METNIIPITEELLNVKSLKRRINLRTMDAEDWIQNHASGTLRKNKKLGMSWKSQYLEERVAYEFGWGFEVLPKSRVSFGDAISEGDCHSVTEAGWHIERYMEMSIFPEDVFECKHIDVEYHDGVTKTGIGIITRQTSASFIPSGHIVFAIVAQYDKVKKEWLDAENPF